MVTSGRDRWTQTEERQRSERLSERESRRTDPKDRSSGLIPVCVIKKTHTGHTHKTHTHTNTGVSVFDYLGTMYELLTDGQLGQNTANASRHEKEEE